MCTRKRSVEWTDLENEDSSDLKVANKKWRKKAPEKSLPNIEKRAYMWYT